MHRGTLHECTTTVASAKVTRKHCYALVEHHCLSAVVAHLVPVTAPRTVVVVERLDGDHSTRGIEHVDQPREVQSSSTRYRARFND